MSAKEPPIVPPRHKKKDAWGTVISEISRHEQSNIISSSEGSLFGSGVDRVTSAFSFFKRDGIEEIKDVEEKIEKNEGAKKEETLFNFAVKSISNLISPAPIEEKKPLLPKLKK